MLFPGSPKGLLIRDFFPPRDFFGEIVSPNVDDYLENPTSKQHLFNAATGLYHLPEYVLGFCNEYKITRHQIPQPSNDQLATYRNYLFEKCPDFSLIEAIALAYKHYSVRDNRPLKSIRSVKDIRSHVLIKASNYRKTGTPDAPIMTIDFAKPFEADRQLNLHTPDGKVHPTVPIITNVRDMWWDELDHLDMDALLLNDLK